jgi:hypothetical protein
MTGIAAHDRSAREPHGWRATQAMVRQSAVVEPHEAASLQLASRSPKD